MADPDCGLCNGDGVIYDWSKRGDPCPECTGGGFHMSSNIKMKASSRGCALVLMVLIALAASGLVVTATRLYA
jgi:hypothetical protein